MILLFDLDDVLANLRQSLYQTLSAATGIDKHWLDWEHYDLTQHYAMSKETLETLLQQEQVLENCVPEPEAAITTHALRELGFRQIIITARGWHPLAQEVTHAWLTQHNIHFDELVVVPLGGNKMVALESLALAHHDVTLAIDDHPNNVNRYLDHGIPTLMVDMPWNQTYQAYSESAPPGNRDNISAQRIYSLTAVVPAATALTATDIKTETEKDR